MKCNNILLRYISLCHHRKIGPLVDQEVPYCDESALTTLKKSSLLNVAVVITLYLSWYVL